MIFDMQSHLFEGIIAYPDWAFATPGLTEGQAAKQPVGGDSSNTIIIEGSTQ